ncbi:hypothetical protein HY642_05220 [Candidatus Woesearchaeota archaeon]|nr:hypothetical protein [Candidatus Woesearchaeota archaeon]
MAVATVKNVDPEAWKLLKAEAARHDLPMGVFLGRLIKDHLGSDELERRRQAAARMDAIRQKVGKFNASALIRKWRDTRYGK